MTFSRRQVMGLATAASAALALGACSNDQGTSGRPAGTAGTAAETGKLAVVQKVLTSEFWQNVKKGAEEQAKTDGASLDVYAANSEDDVEGQVNLLQTTIAKGYAAIGVAPISNVNLNATLANATKQGIYVVNVDEPVDLANLKSLGGAVQGLITTDNVHVGNMAADYIAKLLGSRGDVAIIEGKAGVASGEDRKNGARQGMEKAGLKVVDSQPADWDRTKAVNVAQNYLSKYPQLKAIYCCNDTMAMGALEAVKNSGRDVKVVGTDGNSDAVQSVFEGELAGTIKQDSKKIGSESVKLLEKLAKEKPSIDMNAKPETIHVEPILVTRENAKEVLSA